MMTRKEKEQRIQNPDGKVFEILDVAVREAYRSQRYSRRPTSNVITSTGYLKVFELTALSRNLPSFVGRWHESVESLDIDIEGVSRAKSNLFKSEKGGYIGHHSKRVPNTTTTYSYEVRIHTPQERIFEGSVAFTVVRRQGITGRATVAPPPPSASYEALEEKQVFCAACKAETTHKLFVDHNREIVAICDCGRCLKFPWTDTKEQLDALLAAHRKANRRVG